MPPGLGSYATKDDRLDARLAAALMGIQAVKGVEIGDGFALAGLLGSEAHDEIRTDRRRDTNHAGGIEAGISNGEEIVVRAAMKPLPTLMKPLRSVDLETGEAAQALVERSDVAAVEALAVVAEAAVAWELARTARDKFGGDAIADFVAAHRAYVERIEWPDAPNALGRHLALVGFMGAGKSSLRRSVAERLNRDGVDLDGVIESRIGDIATFFARARRAGVPQARGAGDRRSRSPDASRPCSTSAAAPSPRRPFGRLLEQAFVVFVDVDVDTAWRRARGSDRPLAQNEAAVPASSTPSARPLYLEVADAVVTSGDPDAVLLAAAGVHHAPGALERLGELVPGTDPVALVADARVLGIHGAAAQERARRRACRACTRFPPASRPSSSRWSSASGRSFGSTGAAPSSRSAAARRPTPRASPPRPTCAACRGSPCRRRSSARSTRRSAARPAIDIPRGQEPRRRLPLAGARP